jgi:protein-S-isoprenylcysteine O-methyltransferase Ste14
MPTLELQIPPPLVAAFFVLIMRLLPLFPEPAFLTRSLRILLAISIVLIGQGIAISGMLAFRRAQTTINPVRAGDTSSLVRSGVYKLTRNPMYSGWSLTLIAWALYLGNLVALCALPLFISYITRFQIKPEERILSQLFGAEFSSYSKEVRRSI